MFSIVRRTNRSASCRSLCRRAATVAAFVALQSFGSGTAAAADSPAAATPPAGTRTGGVPVPVGSGVTETTDEIMARHSRMAVAAP
jgi:hypothetical protein